MDEWLSLSDAARLLGVHPSTVRLWSDKGVLPTHRTSGGHRRYTHQMLNACLSQVAGLAGAPGDPAGGMG